MGAKKRVVGKKRTRAEAEIPETNDADEKQETTTDESTAKPSSEPESKPTAEESSAEPEPAAKPTAKKPTAKKPTAKPTAKKSTAKKSTAKPSEPASEDKDKSENKDHTEDHADKASDPDKTTSEKEAKPDGSAEKPKATKATAKPRARATGKRTAATTAPPPAKKQKVQEDGDDSDSDEEVSRWKDWKRIYLVGTEWDNYKSVFEINWDFEHLRHDLLEGFLAESPNKKYIFGTTEGFMLAPDPKKPDEERVTLVPVIVVVDTKIVPPEKLGITSVQRGEEIKNMKDFKMEWIPYYPPAQWKTNPSRFIPKVFFLQCVQRQSVLDRLPLEFKKEYEYALPYIWIPKNQSPTQFDSNLQIVTTIGGRGLTFEFDYKYDEIDEIVDNYLPDPEDKKKHRAELEAAINKHIDEAKQKIKDEKARIEKEKQALGPAKLEALNTLQCYKYYPQNPEYKIERASFINRYYGKASRVFPEPQAAQDYSKLKLVVDTPMADADKPNDVPTAEPADSAPKSDPGPALEPAADEPETGKKGSKTKKPAAKKGGRKATAKPSGR